MSYYRIMNTGPMAGSDAADDLPAWERWTGADGQVYARLRDSSPPVVLHAADWDDLRTQIHGYLLMQLL
jgi:hypothetical protein